MADEGNEGRPSDAAAIPKRKVVEFKNQSLWSLSFFKKTLGTGRMTCLVLLDNGKPCDTVYSAKTANTNLVHHLKKAHGLAFEASKTKRQKTFEH